MRSRNAKMLDAITETPLVRTLVRAIDGFTTLEKSMIAYCLVGVFAAISLFFGVIGTESVVSQYSKRLQFHDVDYSPTFHKFFYGLYCIVIPLCKGLLVGLGSALFARIGRHFLGGREYVAYALVVFLLFEEFVWVCAWGLEITLINDMAVHIIDMDLLGHIGIVRVLLRQLDLWSVNQLVPAKYLQLARVVLLFFIALQPITLSACYFLASRYWKEKTAWSLRLLGVVAGALVLALIWFVSLSSIASQPVVYGEMSQWLPFNAIVLFHSSFVFIPLHVRTANASFSLPTSTALPSLKHPLDNRYPTLEDCHAPNKTLSHEIKARRNIIWITAESWDLEHSTVLDGANLHKYTAHPGNRCVKSKRHYSLATVTEMAHFTLLYSILPSHYDQFSRQLLTSFPICFLRQHGYETGYFSASSPWMYPSNVMIHGNFDHHHAKGTQWENSKLLASFDEWLASREKRKATGKDPVFLHFHIHTIEKSYEPEDRRKDFIHNDIDRERILNDLDKRGYLDNAVVIISNDHGIRDDRNGEGWRNYQIHSPFFICFPSSHRHEDARVLVEKSKLIFPLPGPDVTSHLDLMPTSLGLLGISPKIPSSTFSHGIEMPLPAFAQPFNDDLPTIHNSVKSRQPPINFEVDTTVGRVLFLMPRFFPRRSKNLGIIDTERKVKFWYRIDGYDQNTNSPHPAFTFTPLQVLDIDDRDISIGTGRFCRGRELRALYYKVKSSNPVSSLARNPISNLCFMDRLVELLEQFSTQNVFWKFVDLNRDV